jgi:hypothetical protein
MSRRVSEAAAMLGRLGGKARAAHVTPELASQQASIAAKSRWGEIRKRPCFSCGLALGLGKLTRSEHGWWHVECRYPGSVEGR